MNLKSNVKDQTNSNEAMAMVNLVLNENFPGINAIEKFNEYDGWKKYEKVFITTDELNELYEPPFRKELQLVKEKMQNEEDVPSSLKKYLLANDSQVAYEDVTVKRSLHYGSYTDDYEINRKQWDIAKNVNQIDLLAVNGPPGTGKTTLLKEIIADQLVAKASELISVWDTDWVQINSQKKLVYQSPFKGENQHSIVVTSTNNKAVDNIGEELLKEIPYLPSFLPEGSTYAGMLCARLGNKKNVEQFQKDVFNPLLSGLKDTEEHGSSEGVIRNFNSIQSQIENHYQKIQHFETVYNELSESVAWNNKQDLDSTIQGFTRKRSILTQEFLETQRLDETVSSEMTSLEKQAKEKGDELNESMEKKQQSEVDIKEFYQVLETYRSYNRFKFLAFFFKKRQRFFKEYPSEEFIKDAIYDLKEKTNKIDIQSIKKKKDKIVFDLKEVEEKKHSVQSKIEMLKVDRERIEKKSRKFEALRSQQKQIEADLQINLDKLTGIHDLYNAPIIVSLRKTLFDHALLVQKAYILKHSKAIIHNLEKVFQNGNWFESFYNSNPINHEDNKRGMSSLWETLFLCFPVVTTTLHSFDSGRLQMIKELIDLMLVDESGQILPHYLVGTLYRTKRAIVVGDVHQLEPVRLQSNRLIESYSTIEEKQS